MMRSLKRAVIGADAHGDAPSSCITRPAAETSRECASSSARVFLVGVFPHREFLLIRVIAGIDAYFLDPFRRLHRGFGLEMNVRHQRDVAMPRARSPAAIFSRFAASLTVGAVIRTISQPTATRSSVCATRLRRVHRVASDHRLDANRIVSADTDSSHPHLAGSAPRVSVNGL